MKNIHLIAAARPNFMKIAPLYHALANESWARPIIVHTGQHYDVNMSDAFFRDLGLPAPHLHLGVGSGSHAEQTGQVMIAYEKILYAEHPDMVVVVGDVNSTVACALAAAKVWYRPPRADEDPSSLDCAANGARPLIAHLEAGLRSYDRSMPEEINRLTTDALADLLWTPSPDGDENLLREGVARERIVRVGNIMIDSLERLRPAISALSVPEELGLTRGGYGVVTLHRPANVDDPAVLRQLWAMLERTSARLPLVFPVHPRTRKSLDQARLSQQAKGNPRLLLLEPQSYLRFMNLVFHCRLALTDSGGIQEETTYLGVPCLTMRPNTERPITVHQGTNRLCGLDEIEGLIETVVATRGGARRVPELWDGHTAERVVASMRHVWRTV